VAGSDVVVRNAPGGYRTEVSASGHTLVTDEPASVGGTEAGPTPYDLLLGAVGACTAMTVRMYAGRKGWPLEEVTVRLRQARDHAEDCADCTAKPVAIARIEREITISGDLTEEQRTRLLQVAERCPVGQTLAAGMKVETVPPGASPEPGPAGPATPAPGG
jgi:putative redox protein